jgi:hypothetical protein
MRRRGSDEGDVRDVGKRTALAIRDLHHLHHLHDLHHFHPLSSHQDFHRRLSQVISRAHCATVCAGRGDEQYIAFLRWRQ